MYDLSSKIVAQIAASREARKTAGKVAVKKPSDAASKTLSFKTISTDEFGVIVGIGGAAGSKTKLDLDGEFVDKADLQRMAFDFCGSANRKFKANHQEDIEVKLVQSWVGAPIIEVAAKSGGAATTRLLAEDEVLTKDMNVVGISTLKGHESHWFVGVLPIDPAILEIAKAGGISGFSWSGLVSKTEVD